MKYGLSVQVDGGESEKATIYGADISNGRDIGPILGGSDASHFFPLFAIRAKDFAPNKILNTLQGLPKTLSLFGNYGTEVAVLRDAQFSSLDETGHFNGTLPEDNDGDYGLAESLLLGPDGAGEDLFLLTEDPEELPLAIQDLYTATDMGTLEGNFVGKKKVSGKELVRFYIAPNKAELVSLTPIYDLVREAITTEYDSKFDFPTANEDYEIVDITGGTITLIRKHSLEPGFRFVINNFTFYVRTVPSVFTLTLSTSRGGGLYSNYTSDGITVSDFGRGFYDVVIDNAVASRARPIDQGAIVFAARRLEDSLSITNLGEINAEWMKTSDCSTTNSYNVIDPAPEVRAFLNYGLR
jgi:hypothetical protein